MHPVLVDIYARMTLNKAILEHLAALIVEAQPNPERTLAEFAVALGKIGEAVAANDAAITEAGEEIAALVPHLGQDFLKAVRTSFEVRERKRGEE